jgi:hypothetical protein
MKMMYILGISLTSEKLAKQNDIAPGMYIPFSPTVNKTLKIDVTNNTVMHYGKTTTVNKV